MTPAEFRRAHNLTPQQAAKLFGWHEDGRNWRACEKRGEFTGSAKALARLLEMRPELVAVLREDAR